MAAYNPYQLLRVLIERVGWPNTNEKGLALDSVAEMERMNLFGELAHIMQCEHPDTDQYGRCADCGSQQSPTAGTPIYNSGPSNYTGIYSSQSNVRYYNSRTNRWEF